jgi:hypothetical protein
MVERRRDSWDRFGPLAGVAAVALWILGFVLFLATEVEGAETAAEILAGYEEDENQILLAAWVFGLGGVLFLWFLGTRRLRLLAAEGASGRLTAVAFGAGIATAVFLISLPLGDAAAALTDDLEPAAAQALNEVGTAFFIGAELSAVALTVATGLVILRTGVLPRWLGWVSLVLGLWLLIAPIGWLGLIAGFPLWVLALSFLLWQRGETVEPQRAGAAGPAPTVP